MKKIILKKTLKKSLQKIEDGRWIVRAEEVHKEGYLGPSESAQLLQDLLNATD